KLIQESKAWLCQDETKGVIPGYMKKIEESKAERNPSFTERHLVGNVTSFLMGGTISMVRTLLWQLLNFAENPDTIQERVQREIDEVIGNERLPTWEDRKLMPYTMACVLEAERRNTTAPLGVSKE
ncbi:hypothetical protein MTO96_029829, partial [Rhipicephalus appendiculatus]